MFRRFAAIAVLLFLPLSVYGQDETVRKTIAELDPITSPQLLLDDNILFGVDILGTPNDSRHLTLTQLKNRGHVIAVNVIADMPSLLVSDGQLVATRGRIALGDGGARLYRYSATATASADGVYIVNGPSGTGRFIELASEKADLAASGIGNDAAIKFAVEDEGTSTPYSIALSEILKRSAVTSVATIADLATLAPKNGQIVITRGQATVGDGGGRIYRYDLTSNATADGVYKVLGPSSVGRYIEIASERTNIASSAIANNSAIKFYVEDTTNRQIRGYTLAELLLKTAGGGGGGSVDVPVLTSDTIAGMSALAPSDGDVVITLGGAAKGDGGSRVYRYDLAATAISNGTSIVDGPGGNGRYIDIESERNAITSESIADNSAVKLVVHNSVTNARSTYTLAELLEKTGVPGGDRQPFLAVNRIADLAGLSPQNGDIVVTRGQVTAGDGGARMYRYDSGSSAVADGIYIVTGPGGTGRYLELIQERQALTAAAIANNALVEFNVQNKADNTPRRMTLAELFTRADTRYYTESEVDASLANKADALHSHVIGNVTGLQTALDNRLIVGNNLSDVQNAGTARANLGLEIGTDVQAQLTAASQAEMEAGTEAALRTMSPLRVAQAIAALGEASQVKVVDDVAAMKALTGLANGNIVMTLSYDSTHPGIGANVYRYTTGSGTEDGGFFFTATGMGSGGFEAVDQTVADVTKFGAVGDGVTDDTAEVKAAIRASQALNIPTIFPLGTYSLSTWTSEVLTDDIRIDGEGATLVGVSGQNFIAIPNGISVDLQSLKFQTWLAPIFLQDSASSHESVIVRQCTFSSCFAALTDTSEGGVESVDKVVFADNEVSNCSRGLFIRPSNIVLAIVADNTFKSISHTSSTSAICLSGNTWETTGQIRVLNNYIESVASSASDLDTHGVLAYGENVQIVGNTVKNVTNGNNGDNAEGIYIKVKKGVIANNLLIDAGTQSYIHCKGNPSPGADGEDLIVYGNHCEQVSTTYGYTGIWVERSRSQVFANRIKGTQRGIEIAGGDHKVFFNHMDALSTPVGKGTGTAIHSQSLSTGAGNVMICNNTVNGISVADSTAVYGIYVRGIAGSTTQRIRVSGNILRGLSSPTNSEWGVTFQADAAMSDVVVSENCFDDMQSGIHSTNQANLSNVRMRGNSFVGVGDPITTSIRPGTTTSVGVTETNTVVNGVCVYRTITATDGDTTPSVANVQMDAVLLATNNTGATTLYGLDDAVVGQEYTIVLGGNDTIAHNTTTDSPDFPFILDGAANLTPGNGGGILKVLIHAGFAKEVSYTAF